MDQLTDEKMDEGMDEMTVSMRDVMMEIPLAALTGPLLD